MVQQLSDQTLRTLKDGAIEATHYYVIFTPGAKVRANENLFTAQCSIFTVQAISFRAASFSETPTPAGAAPVPVYNKRGFQDP
jgi:hypothetical protein